MEPWREELYHHGILGQKWGAKNGPPYPLRAGDHSAAEKRKNPGLAGMIKERKRKKARAAALEKARQTKAANAAERKKAEEHAANKEKVLKSGTASDILKYRGELTNEELRRALDRINLESQLSQISARSVKTGWDRADKVMKDIGKLTSYAETVVKAYNTGAKVMNSLAGTELKIIGDKGKDKKKDKKGDNK